MKGFHMKSIRYVTLACLLVGSMHMQAMNNDNNNNQLTGNKRSQPDEQQPSPFSALSTSLHNSIDAKIKNIKNDLINTTRKQYSENILCFRNSFLTTYEDNNTAFFAVNQCCYDKNCKKQYSLPILRGKLADILFVRAMLEVWHRDNVSTPDAVRGSFITKYIDYSKKNRTHYYQPEVASPVSDADLEKELLALKNITFTCTQENTTKLVQEKLSVLLPHANDNSVDQISTYLLQDAYTQYFSSQLQPLINTLHQTYRQTLYKGV